MRNVNLHGVHAFCRALFRDPALLLPHFSYKSFNDIPFQTLKRLGFRGLVIDKDNTLTVPHERTLRPEYQNAINECKRLFKIVIFSNSAGSSADTDFSEANQIESELQIPVLRHHTKKPHGINSIRAHFHPIPIQQLVMIGDRYSTDVLFGNLNGLLTIRTDQFTRKGERFGNVLLQQLEQKCIQRVLTRGVGPCAHPMAHPSILPVQLKAL
uniref:Uncharacterized protein AlNc14C162G7803 n=1 Tax=Albugo laibachii Nc14 TaxID=890382 RepID=F0WMW7_9STRA|nr:conserved hypothetical protein [Albugo laibachii Nc14]|eukprot:CCA22652.1 conserved hypothetical protein [Albugo laibachii Nc14]